MLLADALQVPGEVRLHYGRQHRHAVLVALAAPYDDLVRPEIHVLDAEGDTGHVLAAPLLFVSFRT
jgi:hypothetical protein